MVVDDVAAVQVGIGKNREDADLGGEDGVRFVRRQACIKHSGM